MIAPLSAHAITLISHPGEGRYLIIDGQTPLQALLDTTPHTPSLLLHTLQLGEITWQYRNETTIASALAGEAPAVPWLVSLASWGGDVFLDNDQEIPIEDYLARKAGARRAKGLRIPLEREGQKRSWGEAHVSITPADRPIVLAAAVLTWNEERIMGARLSVTGVSRNKVLYIKAISAWIGQTRSEVDAAAFATQVAASFQPRGDFRGSAEYRREMAGVVIRRALTQALKGEEA